MSENPNLNDFMEFDFVVEVLPGGEVVECNTVRGPDCVWTALDQDYGIIDHSVDGLTIDGSTGWSPLCGYSRFSDTSPIMSRSDVIGDALELYLISHPGIYVAVPVQGIMCEHDEPPEDVGWAVLKYEK